MITKPFEKFSTSRTAPLDRASVITPADGTDLPFETRAFMVGIAGDVSVTTASGDTVTLPALVAGVIYPIALHRVRATGTTAQTIVALA